METAIISHQRIASQLVKREQLYPNPLTEERILTLLDRLRHLPSDNSHLLDINLCAYVANPFTPEATFDFDRLRDDLPQILHLVDDTIADLWETEGTITRSRLGITAQGDMLKAMGLSFGSMAATELCLQIHRTMDYCASQTWQTLLRERGNTAANEGIGINRRIRIADPELVELCLQTAENFNDSIGVQRGEVTETRPTILEADVVRFQNNKEKWVAFVGLLNGRPYEIFTGLMDDDEGIMLPKSVTKGRIIKAINPDGTKRYDFQFENKRGYKTTVEGLSEKFNPEYWNYAKLISGVLRYQMPLENVLRLVSSLQLESQNINTWKVGVERALKKYTLGGADIELEGME